MLVSQFKGFIKSLSRYLKQYGGWRAVVTSPLFLVALATTALNYSRWMSGDWVALSQSLLPTLLGFSLGTYAILFSLITARLRTLKSLRIDGDIAYLDVVNATFFHFIFIQVLGLVWSFLYSGSALYDITQYVSRKYAWAETTFGYLAMAGSFVGYLLMVYSILLILAAALAVYRLAGISDSGAD